jgi:hypothetical protein
MKRPDAFRKLRTICQRLDDVDPDTFPVVPLRAYLFGSVLTDKSDPYDIDVILVYDRSPRFSPQAELHAMIRHRPVSPDRASTQLRRGMKFVQLYMVEFGLGHWDQRELLLFIQPRLIWQPGGDWPAVLAQIEAAPLPWPGPLAADAVDVSEAYLQSLTAAELEAQFRQALVEIEGQEI